MMMTTIPTNFLFSLLFLSSCCLIVLQALESSKTAYRVIDEFIPVECDGSASRGDHLMLELWLKWDNETMIYEHVAPSAYKHIYLAHNPTDLEILHTTLQGMCTNAVRTIEWTSAKDVEAPLMNIDQELLQQIRRKKDQSVRLSFHLMHITSSENYQIFEAFSTNRSLVVEYINDHIGVNAINEYGDSPLMEAITAKDIIIISELLNARMPKVNVNYVRPSGYTALFYALRHKDSFITEVLLRRGADSKATIKIKDPDFYLNTPLHEAIKTERRKHAELLVEYGADLYAKNGAGKRPIDMLPTDAVRSTKMFFRKLYTENLPDKEL